MKKITATMIFCLLAIMNVFAQGIKEQPRTTATNPNQGAGTLLLLAPTDNKIFEQAEMQKPLLFRWTPLSPKPKEPVTYRLRVWQLMQGQSATEATRSSQPLVTKDLNNITQAAVNNILTGPCKPPYLCDFAWTVEAMSTNEMEKSLGKSEVYTFKQNQAKSQGDPIHGVDIKLGLQSKAMANEVYGYNIKVTLTPRNAKGDPVHGVDVKPVAMVLNAQGDPVHGVDVKLGAVIKSTNAQGDPVHGVDIKIGAIAKSTSAQGDPVHGVDVKLGATKSTNANGDPVHGVDVKLGFETKASESEVYGFDMKIECTPRNAKGDPIHGVDIKLGATALNAQGDPVHGVDVKLGAVIKSTNANGDPVHGVDVKLGVKAGG